MKNRYNVHDISRFGKNIVSGAIGILCMAIILTILKVEGKDDTFFMLLFMVMDAYFLGYCFVNVSRYLRAKSDIVERRAEKHGRTIKGWYGMSMREACEDDEPNECDKEIHDIYHIGKQITEKLEDKRKEEAWQKVKESERHISDAVERFKRGDHHTSTDYPDMREPDIGDNGGSDD